MEHECIPEGLNSTVETEFCFDFENFFLKRIKGVFKERLASQKL